MFYMYVQIMTAPPSSTAAPSSGYGPPAPDIDIDLDIDLGTPENPIDDINLGEFKGTGS